MGTDDPQADGAEGGLVAPAPVPIAPPEAEAPHLFAARAQGEAPEKDEPGVPLTGKEREDRIQAITTSTSYEEAVEKLTQAGYTTKVKTLARFAQRLDISLKPVVGATTRLTQRLKLAEDTLDAIAAKVIAVAGQPGVTEMDVAIAFGRITENVSNWLDAKEKLV